MLYNFLLVLLILDSVVLIAAILVQSGKGGGLAASFGGAGTSTDAFFGARQAGTFFTKLAWTCGGIFLVLAYVLQVASTRTRVPRSVLDEPLAAPTAPAPRPGTAAPAVPLQQAPAPQQQAPVTQPPAPATP